MTTTIVLPVSREDFIIEVITSLELLDCDPTYTNLLCIVDGDSKLYTKVRALVQGTKFNERLTVQFRNPKPVKKFDIMARRRRIAAIHEFAKHQIGVSDFVFLTEDDTVVPKNALTRLNDSMRHRGVALVEGVEVGRWGTPYIGAWRFDDIYEPTIVTSLAYQDSGVEQIDASGFYCSLVRADLYKLHDFKLFESLGPDVSMGLELRRQGFLLMVDWGVPCKHLNMKGKEKQIIVPDATVVQVSLGRKNENNWQQVVDKR